MEIRQSAYQTFRHFISIHFEWMVFLAGLLAIVWMNPYADNGVSFCLLELAGIPYCPGEGLGHSISLTVRGDFYNALEAHMLGPFAILIILSRIVFLIGDRVFNINRK